MEEIKWVLKQINRLKFLFFQENYGPNVFTLYIRLDTGKNRLLLRNLGAIFERKLCFIFKPLNKLGYL